MSDRDALYRNVCANPDDDTPRLVFADWLQEHGEESQAEFIRVQCRLAEMSPSDPEYVELSLRAHHLADLHEQEWLKRMPTNEGIVWLEAHRVAGSLQPGLMWWFEKGFHAWPQLQPVLEGRSETCSAAIRWLLDHSPSRKIHVPGLDTERLASWLQVPEIGQLRGLGLDRSMPPPSNHLRHFRHGGIDPDGVSRLCEPTAFPALRTVVLGAEPHFGGQNSIEAFAQAAFVANLDSLLLRGPDLLPVLMSARFENLSRLSIWGGGFSAEAFRHLVQSASMPKLSVLHIGRCVFDEDPFAILAKAEHWRLSELDLDVTGSCWSGKLDDLAEFPACAHLRSLRIRTEGADATQVRSASQKPGLSRLRELQISGENWPSGLSEALTGGWSDLLGLSVIAVWTPIATPGQVAHALTSIEIEKLQYLDLSCWPLCNEGAKILAKHRNLASLRSLCLNSCQIGDTGASAILNSPYLQRLESLSLYGNEIRNGVASLSRPEVLPNLVRCVLRNNPLTERVARQLRDRPGVLV